MRQKWYVGRMKPMQQHIGPLLVPFKLSVVPEEKIFGYAFSSMIGPFPDKKSAFLFAAFGKNNPHMVHVSDVVRIGKQHPEYYREAIKELKREFGTLGLRAIQDSMNQDLRNYTRDGFV